MAFLWIILKFEKENSKLIGTNKVYVIRFIYTFLWQFAYDLPQISYVNCNDQQWTFNKTENMGLPVPVILDKRFRNDHRNQIKIIKAD